MKLFNRQSQAYVCLMLLTRVRLRLTVKREGYLSSGLHTPALGSTWNPNSCHQEKASVPKDTNASTARFNPLVPSAIDT